MTREVSQEYDCPQGMDFDLDGESLVYKGQSFYCSGCGQEHTAGVDVQVSTMVEDGDERSWPDLPESAEALRALVAGRDLPWGVEHGSEFVMPASVAKELGLS